jgi:hypothetical protein
VGIVQLLTTRRKRRNGEIVVPPLFVATLVFFLFILVVWIMGTSPLHLPTTSKPMISLKKIVENSMKSCNYKSVGM